MVGLKSKKPHFRTDTNTSPDTLKYLHNAYECFQSMSLGFEGGGGGVGLGVVDLKAEWSKALLLTVSRLKLLIAAGACEDVANDLGLGGDSRQVS